jgi:hypothetical protein
MSGTCPDFGKHKLALDEFVGPDGQSLNKSIEGLVTYTCRQNTSPWIADWSTSLPGFVQNQNQMHFPFTPQPEPSA